MNLGLIILGVIFFVLAEGFFSGSETAIVSCDKLRLKQLAKSGKRSAQFIEKLLERPNRLLSTTLVGTNLSVVISSSLMAGFMVETFGAARGSLLATLIMTPVILIFGEIIPKTIFRTHADFLISWITTPLVFFYYLLLPVIFLAVGLTSGLLFIFGERKFKKTTFLSKEEIRSFIEERSKKEIFKDDQMKIIQRVFHFGAEPVVLIMVPLEKVVTISAETDVGKTLELSKNFKYSRLPVYQDEAKNIIGFVEIKDLITAQKDENILKYTKSILIVPADKKQEELLDEFLAEKTQLALVVGEKAEILGLVTKEDLIEEVIGEIKDEFDK